MNERTMIRVQVVEVQRAGARVVLITRLLTGEAVAGTVLISSTTDASWRVLGSAFIPPEAWQEGRRGLLVERVLGTRDPSVGEELSCAE